MPATYNATLPTALDRLRHTLGDTNLSAPLRQDETYLALIAQFGETDATAKAAEALAAEYGQKPDSVSADGTNVSWRERVKTWLELASRLRTALARTTAIANNQVRTVQPVRYDALEMENNSEYVRPVWWSPGY